MISTDEARQLELVAITLWDYTFSKIKSGLYGEIRYLEWCCREAIRIGDAEVVYVEADSGTKVCVARPRSALPRDEAFTWPEGRVA